MRGGRKEKERKERKSELESVLATVAKCDWVNSCHSSLSKLKLQVAKKSRLLMLMLQLLLFPPGHWVLKIKLLHNEMKTTVTWEERANDETDSLFCSLLEMESLYYSGKKERCTLEEEKCVKWADSYLNLKKYIKRTSESEKEEYPCSSCSCNWPGQYDWWLTWP